MEKAQKEAAELKSKILAESQRLATQIKTDAGGFKAPMRNGAFVQDLYQSAEKLKDHIAKVHC